MSISRLLRWRVVVLVVSVLIASANQDGIGSAQGQARGQRSETAPAAVPRLIQIGGQLKDRTGRPLSGAATVTFAVYADEQERVPLWIEVQTVSLDETGRYRVLLGSAGDGVPSDLFTTGGTRWLGVQATGLSEESRVLLLSVPYALKALDAETLGGRPASDYVVAGAALSGSALAMPSPMAAAAAGDKSIKGTGTPGRIAMFTAEEAIGDTVIVQSGSGSIGVGTTTPAARLDVALGSAAAAARFSGSSSSQLVESVQSGSGGAIIGIASGGGFGVQGFATNANGTGIIGSVSTATGNNTGVWGAVNSPAGVGGLFENNGGGAILRGRASGTEKFRVDSLGAVYAASYRDLAGNPIPGGDITGVGTGTGITGGGVTGDVSVALDTAFTDSRYAPLAHGHVAGDVAGVATLGANTLTGTQTVDGGNVDLDASTAATGNITKNGALFLHNFGNDNTFLGASTGNLSMTGLGRNTAVGHAAFGSNATGQQNTVIGYGSLAFNTGGSSNIAVGDSVLRFNTTGGGNVAVGSSAMQFNTTGTHNTATGHVALRANTTGSFNTATGMDALEVNTTGSSNTAVGRSALANSNGSSNVAVGSGAGANATTGSFNIYLGTDVAGSAGESHAMYLGKQGTQTKTVVAGIRGTAVTGGEMVVVDSNGRLGTAAIAPSADTVGSAQVVDESLTANDLAPNSVTTSELAAGAVTADKVAFSYAGLGANTFSSNQTVNGNVSLTGTLSGTNASFLGSNGTNLFVVTQNGGGNAFSATSNAGIGVGGVGNIGVQGVTSASNGRGVLAWSTHPTGIVSALSAQVSSPNGVAGAFENGAGGKLLTGTVLGVEKFKVDGAGNVYAGGFRDLSGNAIPNGDITAVAVGSGLTGGGTTGNVALALDTPFTDARYAPLMHGHPVSAITGAATLGMNTFTGTQTIDAGNIDLPFVSSATAGTITKGGSLFLHNYGASNTFLGWDTGNLTMTGTGQNTVVGDSAFKFNETGWANTAVGAGALARNSTGVFNIAIGRTTLENNTTGTANVGTGTLSLRMNVTGSVNTATGHTALFSNVSGDGNTALGNRTLFFNTAGGGNTAVGNTALENTTGSDNTAIGVGAGSAQTTGSHNIYLGAPGVAGESDTMYLGGGQTRAFIAGVRGVTTGAADAIPVVVDSNGQLGTMSSSRRFKEDIQDMGSISGRLLQLRPVTFRYSQAFANGTKPVQFGLVAEEVAETFPELAVRGPNGQIETVHYETLNVLLLNEVQQQQKRIERLEQKLNELLAAKKQ